MSEILRLDDQVLQSYGDGIGQWFVNLAYNPEGTLLNVNISIP